MRKWLRACGMGLIRLFGSRIHDVKDGEFLGTALMFPWGGRVHLLGYEGVPLRMVCLPQKKIRYWRVVVGFTKAEVPDYERSERGG